MNIPSLSIICSPLKSGVLLGILLIFVGCGGTELNPAQQKEYESLKTQVSALRSQARQKQNEVHQGYLKSGKLEKKHSLITSDVYSCGTSLKRNKLGPLPFKKRKGLSLMFQRERKIKKGGQKCYEYQAKVR